MPTNEGLLLEVLNDRLTEPQLQQACLKYGLQVGSMAQMKDRLRKRLVTMPMQDPARYDPSIQPINNQMTQVAGTWVCSCGTSNGPVAKFCSNCGKQKEDPSAQPTTTTYTHHDLSRDILSENLSSAQLVKAGRAYQVNVATTRIDRFAAIVRTTESPNRPAYYNPHADLDPDLDVIEARPARRLHRLPWKCSLGHSNAVDEEHCAICDEPRPFTGLNPDEGVEVVETSNSVILGIRDTFFGGVIKKRDNKR
jgi:hypothetical protein